MQDLGYSQGMIATAFQIVSQSSEAVEDALLYLYENQPSEKAFVEYLADMCEG